MVVQERLGLSDHLTGLLVGARNGPVRVPATAWGPTECAGNSGEVPIRLDQEFLAVFGDEEVGSEVAVLNRDLHAH